MGSNSDIKLNTINEAIEAFQKGELIIVVDDEDRENEGDFITSAELITPEKVNFMTKFGRGLICAPLIEERCDELELDLMVGKNTSLHATPFTVSVDLLGHGCTTGISAADRAKTIKALSNSNTLPEDLGRPGHIFPLKAKERGVLRRAGHTEATVDLAKLAELSPAGVLVEIMNDDGTMARLPQLLQIARKFDLKIISIKDLIAYRLQQESLVIKGVKVHLPTAYGDFQFIPFKQKSNGLEHMALIKGTWEKDEPILVRVHSSCATGDIFGSLRCECGEQLHKAMETIEKEGKGVVVYMNQEGRGIGLMNKIRAYKLQEQGRDTVDANTDLGFEADERDYGVGAQILRELGVSKMRLMTNNPIKRIGLEGYGLTIVENIPIEVKPNPYNEFYMRTKKERMGHNLKFFKYMDNRVDYNKKE
jgi:3,4-dihydroxy 2-butanone 4-phosphate synthase/GTP cyclohydrolase II